MEVSDLTTSEVVGLLSGPENMFSLRLYREPSLTLL